MLDLKFVRENPDIVKQNIKNKFQDSKLPLVDEVIALDAEFRSAQKTPKAAPPRRKPTTFGPAATSCPSRSASSWARARRRRPRP